MSSPTFILITPYTFSLKDTAHSEIYPLSLHDALPIYGNRSLIGIKITLMEVIGAPTGGAGTQTRHRAIGLGQIPREVFAAQRLLDRHLTSSSEHLGHGPLLNLDRMAIINYGRYPTVVPNFSLHAKRGDDGVYRLVEHRAGAFPRINIETAQRAHE